jgi:hypothetical protein
VVLANYGRPLRAGLGVTDISARPYADPCEQLVEDLVMKVGEVGWILKSPPTWAVLVVRVGAGWSGRRLEDEMILRRKRNSVNFG